MNIPWDDSDDDRPRNPRRRSYRQSYGPAQGERPPSIHNHIYNRNDPHQDTHDTLPVSPGAARGRSRSRTGDKKMYPPYEYPAYGYPGMAPPPAGYAYPVYAPRSHSRSRSRHRSHSGEKDPRIARYEEEENRRRIIEEEHRKDEERRAEKKRAVEAYKQEEKERERREEEAAAEALRKHEREKEEEEEHERETVAKFKLKEEQKKKKAEEEEKAAYERYKAKEAEKKIKEKEKAEKEDEEYKKRFREHLARAGYAPNQIDAVIAMEKLKMDENASPGTMVHRPGNALARTKSANSASYGQIIPGVRQQVFPKIRRKDIAVETLKHYKLEWEYCKEDTNYIVILEELSEEDTDVLFYHTQKLRAKEKKNVLQIEERGDRKNPQLLLVRRKSSAGKGGRSKSRTRERSRSSAGRIAGAVLGV